MNYNRIALLAVVLLASVFWLRPGRIAPQALAPIPTNTAKSAVIPAAVGETKELHQWIAGWRSGSLPRNAAALKVGSEIAQTRREEMRRLAREDPEEAFVRSLSWSEWAALPEEMRQFVERPFSEAVDFQVLPSCPPLEKGGVNQVHPYRVVVGGETYDGLVYGTKARMTSKTGLPARGFLLDGMAVLGEGAFERLEGDDLKAAQGIFPRGSAAGVSWLSGQPAARTILLGGTLYDLASDAEEGALADVLGTAEKSLNPKAVAMAMQAGTAATGTIAFSVDAAKKELVTANSTWTETSKKVLAVRLSYSSAPTSYSFSLTDMTNLVVATSNNVRTISYNKTWLVPTIATVNLPNTQAYYEANGPDAIVNDTRTALTAQSINRDNYDIVVHAHPQSGGGNFGYAGLGVIGGGNTWINGSVDANVLTHEIGHNYGLGHAHFWAGLTGMGSLGRTGNDGGQVESEEYGDPFDVMGGGGLPAAHYGAHGKAALNWIEPQEVINVVTNGIYRIYRFDYIGARTNANTKLALKIVCPSGDEYWVSHRKLFTGNATMLRGAYVVRATDAGSQYLIDTTPLSKPGVGFSGDRDDAALVVGKSLVDSVGSVRMTTIASGGTAPFEYLDVQVAFTDNTGSYSFYTAADLVTNGLVGSYINTDLRARTTQDDWRAVGIAIAGRRVDSRLSFTSDGWGARAPLHLTGGTDANWDNFSVQWDGYIVVRRPIRLATTSDDSSRFWIDLNNNGVFATTAPEYVNNHWGTGQGATRGDISEIIPPGTYRIRIQYEEGNGDNSFTMNGVELPFQLFTTAARTTPGMTASFVATSLRAVIAQNDWRTSQAIVGSRVDEYPVFKANGWGSLASVGLTAANGTDGDWNNFSVQWDGYITNSVPLKLATVSDDSSRIWIDVNTNGAFGSLSPEYFNNGFGGSGQGATEGAISGVLAPGLYQIRIQYEEGGGDDNFVLAGVPQLPVDTTTLFSSLVFSGTERTTTTRKVAGDFTIQFWIKTTQVFGGEENWTDGAVLMDATDFGVSLGNGKILFGVAGSSTTTIRSGFVADGGWHYVSARRAQSTGAMTLFIDGIEAARGVGATDSLNVASEFSVGNAPDSSRGYIGNLDLVRVWDSARTSEQILGDFHLSRTGRVGDVQPTIRIATLQPNSVQVFWDALSSYRYLEGAAALNGIYSALPTDQNSTNIVFGANAMRFFRLRK